MLLASVDSTGRLIYWSKRQTHWKGGAVRAFVQKFGLAPAHRLQLRMLNLGLFEQIAWLDLDFPSYRPRTELRLNCQVFSIVMTNQQLYVTCLHSVANFEVQANVLVRRRSCKGTCPPAA